MSVKDEVRFLPRREKLGLLNGIRWVLLQRRIGKGRWAAGAGVVCFQFVLLLGFSAFFCGLLSSFVQHWFLSLKNSTHDDRQHFAWFPSFLLITQCPGSRFFFFDSQQCLYLSMVRGICG